MASQLQQQVHLQSFNFAKIKQKTPNNWVNQTAGSSVALIAVKFSGRRWLP